MVAVAPDAVGPVRRPPVDPTPPSTGHGHDQADDERRHHHGQDDPEGEHGVAA